MWSGWQAVWGTISKLSYYFWNPFSESELEQAQRKCFWLTSNQIYSKWEGDQQQIDFAVLGGTILVPVVISFLLRKPLEAGAAAIKSKRAMAETKQKTYSYKADLKARMEKRANEKEE